MGLKTVTFFILVFSLFLFITGCNNATTDPNLKTNNNNNPGSTPVNLKVNNVGTESLKLKLKSTSRFSGASRAITVTGTGPGISNGNFVSFTPTSLILSIKEIGIYNSATSKRVSLTNSIFNLNIAGSNTSELADLSFSISSSDYGLYDGVFMRFNDTATTWLVAGDVTVSNLNYNFSNIAFTNNGEKDFTRYSPFTIDESHPANIKLYFDTVAGLILEDTNNYSPTSQQLGNYNARLELGNPCALIYIGQSEPTIHRYLIQFDPSVTTWGDTSLYGIKITALLDGNVPAAFYWQALYFENYVEPGPNPTHFGFGRLDHQYFVDNGNGSWLIRNADDDLTSPEANRMVIPAFQFTNHTGVLYIGITNGGYIHTNSYFCSNL